jgi:hypothetical protein
MATHKPARGRPRKFNRPARTVTVTLPHDVIDTLAATDTDLGRAIVRLTLPHVGRPMAPIAEVAIFGARAVIIIPPSAAMSGFSGVELMPLADGRALITLDDTISTSDLELQLGDRLADPALAASDRSLMTALHQILRQARSEGNLTTRRILVLRMAG